VSRIAVLFIHGIIGTPRHFTELIPLVQQVPEDFTVSNIILDGHGGTVDDFAHTSMAKWKAREDKNYNLLVECFENKADKFDVKYLCRKMKPMAAMVTSTRMTAKTVFPTDLRPR